MVGRLFRYAVSLFFYAAFSQAALASSVDTKEVDRRIQKLMDRPGMVGLAVAIVEDGEITFARGYGETLRGSGEKVSADTVFRWASVSKSVAAAAIVDVSDDGHFGLSSSANAFAPSLKLPPSKYTTTIEDLLTHQTGLIRNAFDTRLEDGGAPDDIRTALATLDRVCEPGDCHTYQNIAFDAVAEIIESTTELPYKSVVSERIFRPLEMDSASTTYAGLTRSKSWAKPHYKSGKPIRRVKSHYYRVPAAAGVNSSVTDLAKWMTANMPVSGPKLPDDQAARLHAPRVRTLREARYNRRKYPALENAHYGLGWRVYDYAGNRVIGHRGAVEGYRAAVLFDPELKTGVAVMWNSPHARPIGLQLEIMDQVYELRRRDWMRLGRT